MSPSELDVLVQGVIALIALVALGVSIAALHRSRPRLTISVKTVTAISDDGSPARPMTVVTVENSGGADAVISQVILRAVDGSMAIHFPQPAGIGPRLPRRLEANGGRAIWWFDYAELRRSYQRTIRDEDLVLKACVRVGTKVLQSRGTVTVWRPGQGGIKLKLTDRIRSVVSDFRRPRAQLMGFFDASDVDLDAGLTPLVTRNFGWWWSKPFTVSLVAIREGERDCERVPDFNPVRIPGIRPKGTYQVLVPITHDVPPGVSLVWSVTAGPGIGNGVGATTWSEAREIRAVLEQGQSDNGEPKDSPRGEHGAT